MRLATRVGAALALLAAYACGSAPAPAATPLTSLPAISSIAGGELIPCQTGGVTYVCTPAQIIAYANLGALQPLDADLTAIAALGTTSFGRSLLTMADAPTTRSAISAAASGANTDIISITGSAAKLTTARTINGVAFDGSGNITINAVDSTARLIAASNLSDLGSASTARANLGLGTAATYPIGTSGAAVPLLSAANSFASGQVFGEASYVWSRTTGTTPFLLFQGGKASANGASVSYQRASSASQNYFDFETGSSSAPDGYIGTASGVTGRITILTGTGASANGQVSIDITNGVMVGSGTTPGAMTISPAGVPAPGTDNAVTIGTSAKRWSILYAATHCYTSTVCDYVGSGTPLGNLTAAIGSTFRRTDGGTSTTFYVKESGTDATGWVAK